VSQPVSSDLDQSELRAKNTRLGMIALGVACAMVGVGFAAVPLYNLFCRVTGYGGTTQVADESTAAGVKAINKTISVRFDANIRSDLGWDFRPEKTTETVRIGERSMAIFLATNTSGKRVTGQASYNVTPDSAGAYFNKIQCFCFTEQTLEPGQSVRMPVIFYVDPSIVDNPDARIVNQITLSYTFYPVDRDEQGG
jgi:cytochrome c oxidase assembly protein subunit 11